MTIHVDPVDARHLGALFMLLEIATIYAGELYGVNPLDQPGVELGKQFTYAMLGRPDAEQAGQEWNMLPKPDSEVQRLAAPERRGVGFRCVSAVNQHIFLGH